MKLFYREKELPEEGEGQADTPTEPGDEGLKEVQPE